MRAYGKDEDGDPSGMPNFKARGGGLGPPRSFAVDGEGRPEAGRGAGDKSRPPSDGGEGRFCASEDGAA